METEKNNILEEADAIFHAFQPEPQIHQDYSFTYFRELATHWLAQKEKLVKKSTLTNYQYALEKHILPQLGENMLADFTREELLTFLKTLHTQEYANSTMGLVLLVLRSVLREGRPHYFDDSYMRLCSIRREKRESSMLPSADSIRMKSYLLEKGNCFALGLLLSRSTGIRVGELCGLKWGDFDFTKNTFVVRRTVSRITNPTPGATPKTLLYIRSPKSATSKRVIPIPQYLRNYLYFSRREDHCFLLTGTPKCTEPRNVQKRFKTVLRRCKLPDYNFHALRHGFASACLEGGTDCKTISTILGHASVHTTMDIYIHSTYAQKKSCIDSLS